MLLTAVHMQEARSPESGKIDLHSYEGKAIMVSSQRREDDIAYAAVVSDTVGPILTSVVKKLFNLG